MPLPEASKLAYQLMEAPKTTLETIYHFPILEKLIHNHTERFYINIYKGSIWSGGFTTSMDTKNTWTEPIHNEGMKRKGNCIKNEGE